MRANSFACLLLGGCLLIGCAENAQQNLQTASIAPADASAGTPPPPIQRTSAVQTTAAPASPAVVNVNEPGDTSLSCSQLGTQVTKLSDDINVAQQSLQSQQQSQTVSSAARSVIPLPGGMGGMFASVMNAAGNAAEQMGTQQINNDRDRLFRMEARRDNLVAIYNAKCQAKPVQTAARKKG